ncbi:MAG: hypothetical protein Q8O34_06000 [Rhodocyclaceae bacterium]|nr:hypothetical protein [Rhodocyclaceae bacterium]
MKYRENRHGVVLLEFVEDRVGKAAHQRTPEIPVNFGMHIGHASGHCQASVEAI